MHENSANRGEALERLDDARTERAARSERYEASRGSTNELSAAADLNAADEQFAAREAWLKWVERDYL